MPTVLRSRLQTSSRPQIRVGTEIDGVCCGSRRIGMGFLKHFSLSDMKLDKSFLVAHKISMYVTRSPYFVRLTSQTLRTRVLVLSYFCRELSGHFPPNVPSRVGRVLYMQRVDLVEPKIAFVPTIPEIPKNCA